MNEATEGQDGAAGRGGHQGPAETLEPGSGQASPAQPGTVADGQAGMGADGQAGMGADGQAGMGADGQADGGPADRQPGITAAREGGNPAARRAAAHLGLLAVYLAAGVAATWPLARHLADSQLPKIPDLSSYVWDLWWIAHQVTHLGNPWFTSHMAAPVGIRLGYDTTMPLAGLILTPLTLTAGPFASFAVLTLAAPGLACYVMYRAARLWLGTVGAVAAGAAFGLSAMLAWQDWYHLNIALGTLFLPMTLEAAARLRRCPRLRQALILGVVLGAAVLVNQESAVLAAGLAIVCLLPWLARGAAALATRVRTLGLAVAAAALVASPQLIAMIQQALRGGVKAQPGVLIGTYKLYGAGLPGTFAPSPQVGRFGLHQMASVYSYREPKEAMTTFGVVLGGLAVLGLAAGWRHRAWRFGLLWLGCAALALGPTLVVGKRVLIPLAERWEGWRVSLLMPYTWLMHVPGLSTFREADRFALLGLVGAAMLAGFTVDWLRRHAWPAIVVVAALGALEAGWAGNAHGKFMPAAMPALDRPIAADHSGSVVLDVPFGLRGGIPLYGSSIPRPALLLATADGHPRAISYTSWVPRATSSGILGHPFYVRLMRLQNGQPGTGIPLAAARGDARRLGIGWVLVWQRDPAVSGYLRATGFGFDYRADGVSVYRPRADLPGRQALPVSDG